MKKLSLLGMMTLILGSMLYFLLQAGSKTAATENVLRPQVSSTQELFLGSRQPKSSVISSALLFNADCEELTSLLNGIDFNLPVDQWIEELESESLGKCTNPEFATRIQSLRTTCFEGKSDQECIYNAVLLRAVLRTKETEDFEDRTQLADLVLKEFAKPQPDFKNLIKVSEKLMDLNPDQQMFQKLWAMSKVIDTLSQKKSPAELYQEIEARVHPDIWRDEAMIGMDLALKTGLEPNSVEDLVREMLAERNDSKLNEILGWSLWKQNRRAEAIAQLKLALKKNPNDEWLREQYEKVTSRTAGPNDYHGRFSIGFDLNELFE